MTDNDNPLLADWTTPFGIPPFEDIRIEHYRPAFEAALTTHRAEIDAIADNPVQPDFDNVIAALERSGNALQKVASVFFNLCGSNTNDAMQEIQREIAPVLTRHGNETLFNRKLFARINTLVESQGPSPVAPQVRTRRIQ